MATDERTIRKLDAIARRYDRLRFEKVRDVPMQIFETREHFRAEPRGVRWRPAPPGTRWGNDGATAWFRGDVRLPNGFRGRKLLLRPLMGGPDSKTAVRETLLFVNGRPAGAFNMPHREVVISQKAAAGRTIHLSLEAYAGHSYPGHLTPDATGGTVTHNCHTFDGAELLTESEDVTAFVVDLRILLGLVATLGPDTPRRQLVADALGDVFEVVDAVPAERPEESWRPKLRTARGIMRPFLASKNLPGSPCFGIIGHSHLDTAWLWPLDETVRKAARTFASVLNLMDQYPEFKFLQSSALHADMMRREYPDVYARMKRMVRDGRWEHNGGMWVESDTILPAGECLVRQLLVGRNASLDMFGTTSDTLWLPDVFGYSGALPQIMRKCGVEFFCTQKLGWSDTTRFPYQSFVWRGIDGSTVIAHQPALDMGGDIVDRRLIAFGHGDGGGGPTAEQIDLFRRLADLEGAPRTSYTTVSRFMRDLGDRRRSLPTWSGEMLIENHRGTLTSIAGIKRHNRKTEFAVRDAELLCTLAAVNGARYPARRFFELWKTLLALQFHDVLPGTSIAEVNDWAVETLDRLRSDADELTRSALAKLAGPRGGWALVANTLSWDRTSEILLNGIPTSMVPADDTIAAQWVKNIEGRPTLLVDGLSVPALGSAVVPLRRGRSNGASPFKVTARTIATPHARIRFNKNGRITSFVDKATGRELVAGGPFNTFIIGEDVPETYDNWNIDSDQERKMLPDERLIDRKVVADGPLQLRVRYRRRIGDASTLVQDMILHAGTPRVDFETVVDWADLHKLLKVAFEVNVAARFARHEMQFSHVERPTHRDTPHDRARFEVPAHKWTDLSERGFGVALLNDCKYGISVHDRTLGLTLIKSGRKPDPRGDRGRHTFTYSLLPHKGGFSVESVVRPAYELNVAPVVHHVAKGADAFGSLLTVDAPAVIVESVKWAEQGRAFVARLYDAGGRGSRAAVRFDKRVHRVEETNMLEEEVRTLALRGGAVRLHLSPFEIKTLKCEVGQT